MISVISTVDLSIDKPKYLQARTAIFNFQPILLSWFARPFRFLPGEDINRV
jgi:hypothetical protein